MGILDDFSIWVQASVLDVKDWIEDAPSRIPETISNVTSDIKFTVENAAIETEETVTEIKEFCADVKKQLREMEVEAAYNISPRVGEFVEKKQQVLNRIENLINSPKNLTLMGEELVCPKLADHLFVRSGVYTHHGIYIGDGKVIHYSREKEAFWMIDITTASLEEFADGRTIYVLSRSESPLIYTPEEAVGRAWRRFGEEQYDLLSNNCEQFVRWCRSGGEEWDF